MPSRRKSSFSTSRSWPSSSARGGGSGATARGGLDGHVLELVGDDGGARGEAARARPGRRKAPTTSSPTSRGRRVRRRVEEPEPQPERQPGEPEHPAELAAADAGDERHRAVVTRRHDAGSGASSTDCVCAARNAAEPRPDASSAAGQDRRREQRRVDRAGAADRERPDRDPGGHLDDREQRVHALQRLRLDRHAEHGQRRLRRGHPGQVRRAAGARDQHLQAALLGRRRRTRTAGRACGGPRRRAARRAPRARRASRRRAASSPSRSGSP